tara:strand:+ start:6781 stop:7731 length:951 start_codon:yes stop_codon:yes gene_type:complete
MTLSIALDIGGTKTTLGFIDHTTKKVLKKITDPTVTGLSSFPLFIGNLIKTAVKIAKEEAYSLDPRVCIALPGNFRMGHDISIKKGSARQLIHENEHFFDLNITPWLTQYFPENLSLFAINDAMAQAVGSVYTTWCDDYANKVMLFMGPGTGLGGAIIKIGDNREDVTFITDGHIYDVMVDIQGQEWMAEDILSGRGIFERTGVVAKALNERDDYWNQNQGVIHDCADCAVQIVMNIKQKTIQKKCRKNNWSPSDIELAAKIECVLLGGSIGTKGRLGQVLNQCLSHVMDGRVIQSKDTDGNALIGAVLMGHIHGI